MIVRNFTQNEFEHTDPLTIIILTIIILNPLFFLYGRIKKFIKRNQNK